jgi:hypothetical protein
MEESLLKHAPATSILFLITAIFILFLQQKSFEMYLKAVDNLYKRRIAYLAAVLAAFQSNLW